MLLRIVTSENKKNQANIRKIESAGKENAGKGLASMGGIWGHAPLEQFSIISLKCLRHNRCI